MIVVTIALLIVLNIPVAIFLGWLFFEHPEERQGAVEAMIGIGKKILFPRWTRMFLGMDDDEDESGIFPVICVVGGLIMAIAGERYLLNLWAPWLFK
jgi:hypothetical protein